ncbi:uncharacterized protein LOC129939807 [Eupeodes corollae]|uniref:uncharacterized protein LOC129939807 n=1 Tax=Eupeodes corollae TaxID=290404 RepID=UPI002490EFC9|nr:uncharacterized protein LOC129939807 [Eupeodes corollae]
MHPQSEVENYKLQVELLQEKLHRSEDNRQELEEKLEQIMKKRNEHERTLRSRSQLKYQQFLDEQKKRNERNRKLVEMLERIDQQAAALSARSERLKMMKLQYELYFSKLVQSCAMKTLQSIPAVSLRSIERPSNIGTALRPDEKSITKEDFQMFSSSSINNTPHLKRIPLPVVVPIPNEQNLYQPGWTVGCTPPGVLIALPNTATLPSSSLSTENKKIQPNYYFDYSHFPIGYLQEGTSIPPMQYNVVQSSYLKQPDYQQTPSVERHTKQLFASDDGIKQSRPHFEFTFGTPSFLPPSDVKANETIPNRTQSDKLISEQPVCGNKPEPKKHDDLEHKENEENSQEFQNFKQTGKPMFNKNLPASYQSFKVDKLPNIKPNNSFQEERIQEGRRIVHEGYIPNTIDFRTDNDNDSKYINYIKEMEQPYEKNHPIPISSAPQELSIDNITTTLQIRKTEKIDGTNVRDDENINDVDENEKNTSSASSAPLDGKCSIESIGDEALTFMKKPLEYKTEKHISNTSPARNIDPSRDTEQITLFNGTKNSQDESTRASNRTTAIIDGDVGENKENTKNTRMDPNTNPSTDIYHPPPFDKKEKMSIENIETAIYGELLTKPENFSFSDATVLSSDNLIGNGGDDKEIEQNSQQTEGYGYTNLEQDSYEQDPVMGTGHQQVEPYATEIEQIEAKPNLEAENNQGSYSYSHNVGSIEEQQFDEQNYNYSDQSAVPLGLEEGASQQSNVQEYGYSDPNAATLGEVVPQQDYPGTEDGQYLQPDNYAADYQNYDASQYQTEYDQSDYPYDYSQEQYDGTNQSGYAPEAYNQEYQGDQYAEQYANYEANAQNEAETYNEANTEGSYQQVNQKVSDNEIEESFSTEQETSNIEIDNNKVLESVGQELHEEPTEPQATSNPETTQIKSHPTSILATEKNSDIAIKKKKKVNFVDSETDESSSQQKQGGLSSESDFDFSNN